MKLELKCDKELEPRGEEGSSNTWTLVKANQSSCSAGSGVQAPVDGVKEQVEQREGEAGVRVNHVAFADQQVYVFTQRPLPAEASPLRGPDVRGLGWRGEGVRGQGGCQAWEWRQLDVIVMEAAVEGHRLAGVKGGWDLKRYRKKLRTCC